MFQALDEFATKLIESEHYAHDDVATRRNQVCNCFSFNLKVLTNKYANFKFQLELIVTISFSTLPLLNTFPFEHTKLCWWYVCVHLFERLPFCIYEREFSGLKAKIIKQFGFYYQLLHRRNTLYQKSAERKKMLEASSRYQMFERDCDETKGWINEKLKTANDESFKVSLHFKHFIVPNEI